MKKWQKQEKKYRTKQRMRKRANMKERRKGQKEIDKCTEIKKESMDGNQGGKH